VVCHNPRFVDKKQRPSGTQPNVVVKDDVRLRDQIDQALGPRVSHHVIRLVVDARPRGAGNEHNIVPKRLETFCKNRGNCLDATDGWIENDGGEENSHDWTPVPGKEPPSPS